MSDSYSEITARHYAAFRPSLHAPILSKCIEKGRYFESGLDVGCGTGRSTIALAEHCHTVVGIDPSTAMLDQAIQHPKVTYHNGILRDSNIDSNAFDVVTFAGSLFYSKSKALYDEVVRTSVKGARIIVYDFEVSLDTIYQILEVTEHEELAGQYDHEVNFSDLLDGRLEEIQVAQEDVEFEISPEHMAHLALAEPSIYGVLASTFNNEGILEKVTRLFRDTAERKTLHVHATIFYSVYDNNKLN